MAMETERERNKGEQNKTLNWCNSFVRFPCFLELSWMQRKAKCVCRSFEQCVQIYMFVVCTIVTCNCLFTSNWTHSLRLFLCINSTEVWFGSVRFVFPSNSLVIVVSWDTQYFYTHNHTHRHIENALANWENGYKFLKEYSHARHHCQSLVFNPSELEIGL